MIEVRCTSRGNPLHFAIVVHEGVGETRHEVTMSAADFKRLAKGAATPEQCIEAAFRFLLEREPKEAILPRFDVSVIARYFPEFPREFSRYLGPTEKK